MSGQLAGRAGDGWADEAVLMWGEGSMRYVNAGIQIMLKGTSKYQERFDSCFVNNWICKCSGSYLVLRWFFVVPIAIKCP